MCADWNSCLSASLEDALARFGSACPHQPSQILLVGGVRVWCPGGKTTHVFANLSLANATVGGGFLGMRKSRTCRVWRPGVLPSAPNHTSIKSGVCRVSDTHISDGPTQPHVKGGPCFTIWRPCLVIGGLLCLSKISIALLQTNIWWVHPAPRSVENRKEMLV